MSLPDRDAVLQEKATNLIGHSRPIADQARPHAMQRLQIQLLVGLYRNATRRRALDSFRDRLRIPEVVLVTLPERFGIAWRHLLDLVTKRDQLTRYVMRSHAGFDADEARWHIHKSCGNPGPRDPFAQYDRAFFIQTNYMQRVLAGIGTNGAR